MQSLTTKVSKLSLDNQSKTDSAIKIQRWFRSIRTNKLHKLPNVIYLAQQIIIENNITCCNSLDDGRINSCFDEDIIKNLLKRELKTRVKIPKKRKWYDILLNDYTYGWIPVNIKSTTLKSSDNTGNMAMCVQAYTDELLDLKLNHNNGNMSKLLMEKLNSNNLNNKHKKDYYFIVVNKKKATDVIVNSVLGLSELTPNNNNLPFQVCWEKNRTFNYSNIKSKVKMFIECLQQPKPSWRENFMKSIREFNIEHIEKPVKTQKNKAPTKVKLNILNFFTNVPKKSSEPIVITSTLDKPKRKVILKVRN